LGQLRSTLSELPQNPNKILIFRSSGNSTEIAGNSADKSSLKILIFWSSGNSAEMSGNSAEISGNYADNSCVFFRKKKRKMQTNANKWIKQLSEILLPNGMRV
jgi:hypothetical protein